MLLWRRMPQQDKHRDKPQQQDDVKAIREAVGIIGALICMIFLVCMLAALYCLAFGCFERTYTLTTHVWTSY